MIEWMMGINFLKKKKKKNGLGRLRFHATSDLKIEARVFFL